LQTTSYLAEAAAAAAVEPPAAAVPVPCSEIGGGTAAAAGVVVEVAVEAGLVPKRLAAAPAVAAGVASDDGAAEKDAADAVDAVDDDDDDDDDGPPALTKRVDASVSASAETIKSAMVSWKADSSMAPSSETAERSTDGEKEVSTVAVSAACTDRDDRAASAEEGEAPEMSPSVEAGADTGTTFCNAAMVDKDGSANRATRDRDDRACEAADDEADKDGALSDSARPVPESAIDGLDRDDRAGRKLSSESPLDRLNTTLFDAASEVDDAGNGCSERVGAVADCSSLVSALRAVEAAKQSACSAAVDGIESPVCTTAGEAADARAKSEKDLAAVMVAEFKVRSAEERVL
jgi:hypothetical protein